MKQTQFVAKVNIQNHPQKEIVKDAIIWALTYGHLEVFKKTEFESNKYVSEYPLAIHVQTDVENLVFTNIEEMASRHAEEAADLVEQFGIMGLIAWFAYREGVNDVIHECYKTEEYNKAREYLGLGGETQMEEDYEVEDSETLEVIILAYCDGLCDLQPMEGDYQEWFQMINDDDVQDNEGGDRDAMSHLSDEETDKLNERY